MAAGSKIEWTDATWNPVTGCTKVGPGCDNCYAERFAERFRGVAGHPYEPGFDLTLRPERLDQPLRWRKPRMVFVNSMSDLFHKRVPFHFVDDVFHMMEKYDHHVYQVLTKRSSRMRQYVNGRYGGRTVPRHIWLGVSIEDQRRLSRAGHLQETRASVRFLSLEPLIGPIKWLNHLQRIHWVIVGGESGPRARPMHPDWARSINNQCQAAGVPFFFKQWGAWGPLEHSAAADQAGWDGRGDWRILSANGDLDIPDHRWPDEEAGEVAVVRVGKKAAGRLLDGREWNQMPEARR
jgi:protein gp37|tara:strand:- start:216 stop:1094 length:879 start_codon:yes stop_codon:yes gene_type:complete